MVFWEALAGYSWLLLTSGYGDLERLVYSRNLSVLGNWIMRDPIIYNIVERQYQVY